MVDRDYVRTRRQDVKPIPKRTQKLIRPLFKVFTRLNVFVYKRSGGRLMNRIPGAGPICIVAMTGRKTGKERNIPLMDINDGDNKILVASQGGLDKHPVWYFNLKANPEVEITAHGVTRRYRARQVDEAEKAKLWPLVVETYPPYDEYQARTDRDIPVFVCEPLG